MSEAVASKRAETPAGVEHSFRHLGGDLRRHEEVMGHVVRAKEIQVHREAVFDPSGRQSAIQAVIALNVDRDAKFWIAACQGVAHLIPPGRRYSKSAGVEPPSYRID